ncbi:TPA: DNA gyrase subunit A [Candidatus Dependentiae bacterium]|nr:MAG: gyrase subunit A protein [candidate division TM6 bacterium GW2011_GWF2_36_131]KKQ02598.1 MAG: gyrase subunit A protein [candidate division TM6 bacterium GW2011_GWE2_36_25]KKQ19093.1 MAG: gyrase subunit A protein [candidate division TM6 bacterium GW2011_GWA2_36_9]HBR70183.1 DNA gyrase subunit A [Candidatus Dependentiae bacterium]HCU00085.1 DNA gyrase subunit A [Candidatus Dependentiae bacterium]
MDQPTAKESNFVTNVNVKPVQLEDELKQSFLDYAMSVIVSRALPDIRDGLKPVHRRILYTMDQLGFTYNKPYHKSVRVVGDVLGKYHPHGDQAVYQTMVGMVQEFAKRYPLLDGQGNWGSVDGDAAAAMRYTEVRMQKISQELLADLDKETVKFVPNFDESTVEPVVLPSRIPNLLVNGSAGIAVGMATSIPPHNLGEIIDACLALLKDPTVSEEDLFSLVPAPDFPTGGIICGRSGIVRAYKTGRGNLIMRAVVDVEETKKGSALVVKELPYQVNKAELAIKIAQLVKDKIVEGITNIRDESNKKGMRLVIELRRGDIPSVVLNQLYKHTSLQTSISILMLGLLDNQPVILPLREILRQFLLFREEVVYRRTQFDMSKAKAREHILAGFIIALGDIDEVVQLIKKSKDTLEAIALLNKRFLLSEIQGKAILEMRLQRLTGLEREKIRQEMDDLKKEIARLQKILDSKETLHQEIINELEEIKKVYADERRSLISGAIDILTEADLIPDEDVVITLTKKGYIKRVLLSTYGIQHRGGKGKMGVAAVGDTDDLVQDVFVTRNHDDLLFFTNLGRVYGMRVFEVPEASRIAKGRAVVNLLPLAPDEHVVKLLCAHELKDKYIVMLTKEGIIKRTDAQSFEKIRSTGIRAVTLREGDELVFCDMSHGNDEIIIATANGQGIHFKEKEVRSMGRQAAGVMGVRLRKGDLVVGMEVISDPELDVLFATQKGYGKKVKVKDFRVSHRGGVGVRTIPADERNGLVVGIVAIKPESNILLIDTSGKIIRLSPAEVRTMGRQARGVRLIRLDKDQKLISVVAFEEQDGGDTTDQEDESNNNETKLVPKKADEEVKAQTNSDEQLTIN